MGCVAALALVLGGGVTYVALNRGGEDPTAASTTSSPSEPAEETPETPSGSETEEPEFTVVSPIDVPPGDVEELTTVMATSPLTEGSLPDVADCELPATPVDHDTAELQAVLDAAAGCLNQVWATTSSDRGLPWEPLRVQV
ncbi:MULTISPECIES: hypothetical protein [unclassified Brachybacterium]|uniref:hypothetical protein n=1 Tax=unclassified Brachybacterium TaxID=2623841 RepID=UPI00361A21E3